MICRAFFAAESSPPRFIPAVCVPAGGCNIARTSIQDSI
jgi:hypothetical protein